MYVDIACYHLPYDTAALMCKFDLKLDTETWQELCYLSQHVCPSHTNTSVD